MVQGAPLVVKTEEIAKHLVPKCSKQFYMCLHIIYELCVSLPPLLVGLAIEACSRGCWVKLNSWNLSINRHKCFEKWRKSEMYSDVVHALYVNFVWV